MTNNKRDYKKEYQAFVLRKQNNKEYAEKHRKDGAARSNKSWHKNKTPEKQKQKRLMKKLKLILLNGKNVQFTIEIG